MDEFNNYVFHSKKEIEKYVDNLIMILNNERNKKLEINKSKINEYEKQFHQFMKEHDENIQKSLINYTKKEKDIYFLLYKTTSKNWIFFYNNNKKIKQIAQTNDITLEKCNELFDLCNNHKQIFEKTFDYYKNIIKDLVDIKIDIENDFNDMLEKIYDIAKEKIINLS